MNNDFLLQNLPEKKIGIEHEAKFIVTENEWKKIVAIMGSIPVGEIVKGIKATQSTIYFDTSNYDLMNILSTLGVIINPGYLSEIGWLIYKTPIDVTGIIRHVLEVAARINPVELRSLFQSNELLLPLRLTKEHLKNLDVILTPKLVSIQKRQKYLIKLPNNQLVGVSLDNVRYKYFHIPNLEKEARFFELEVNHSEFETINYLTTLINHYSDSCQLKSFKGTKYSFGIELLQSPS